LRTCGDRGEDGGELAGGIGEFGRCEAAAGLILGGQCAGIDPGVERFERSGHIAEVIGGEGFVAGGQPQWKGTNNQQKLAVQRLTGRWVVSTNQ
jgi:hypothetical protein